MKSKFPQKNRQLIHDYREATQAVEKTKDNLMIALEQSYFSGVIETYSDAHKNALRHQEALYAELLERMGDDE